MKSVDEVVKEILKNHELYQFEIRKVAEGYYIKQELNAMLDEMEKIVNKPIEYGWDARRELLKKIAEMRGGK